METGKTIEIHVLNDEFDEIPSNFVEGWGSDRGFHKPKYDFTIGDWVENIDQQELLDNVRQSKIIEMDNACKNAILGNFKATINDVEYEFSFDSEAQADFTGTMTMFIGGVITETEWTAWKDGLPNRIILNQDQFRELAKLAYAHKDGKVYRLRNKLEKKINESVDVEEIRAITWDSETDERIVATATESTTETQTTVEETVATDSNTTETNSSQ